MPAAAIAIKHDLQQKQWSVLQDLGSVCPLCCSRAVDASDGTLVRSVLSLSPTGMLENGLRLEWLNAQCAFITYESHVLFTLRFMVDCGVVGGGWVELPASSYQVLPLGAA